MHLSGLPKIEPAATKVDIYVREQLRQFRCADSCRGCVVDQRCRRLAERGRGVHMRRFGTLSARLRATSYDGGPTS